MFEDSLIDRVGWTLLHSLWQIALIAALVAVCHRLLIRRSANARYVAGCLALLAMIVVPGVTFCTLAGSEDTIGTSPLNSTATDMSLRIERPLSSQQPPTVDHAAVDSKVSDIGEVNASSVAEAVASPLTAVNTVLPVDVPSGLTASVWHRLAMRLDRAMPTVVVCWMIGVLLLSIRPLFGLHVVHRLRSVGRGAVEQRVLDVVSRLCKHMNITRAVEVAQSALVDVPAVVGTWRPLLLLPASALTGLTAEQLEAVIAHELAHIRRHDFPINILQTIVETVLFYHPAVWWVSRIVRQEREHFCDDIALAVGNDRTLYAETLVLLDKFRRTAPALTIAANGGSLVQRVRRIVDPHVASRRGVWPGGVVLVLILAVVLTVFLRGGFAGSDGQSVDLLRTPVDDSAEAVSAGAVTTVGAIAVADEPAIAERSPAVKQPTMTDEQRIVILRRCLVAIIDEVGQHKDAYVELADFDPEQVKAQIAAPDNHPLQMGFSFEHNFDGWNRNNKQPMVRKGGCYFFVDLSDPNNPSAISESTPIPGFGVAARVFCVAAKDANPKFAKTIYAIMTKHLKAIPHYETFAQMDAKLRIGLIELAESFPQLKTTNEGPLASRLEGKSNHGEVRVVIGRFPRRSSGNGAKVPVPRVDTQYQFVFVINTRDDQRPVYPELNITGDVYAWARDKRLQNALDKLISDCLAPLNELRAAANAQVLNSDQSDVKRQADPGEQMQPVKSSQLTGIWQGSAKGVAVQIRCIGTQSRIPGRRVTMEGELDGDVPQSRIGAVIGFSDNASGAIDLTISSYIPKTGESFVTPVGRLERGTTGNLYLTIIPSERHSKYPSVERIRLIRVGDQTRLRGSDLDKLIQRAREESEHASTTKRPSTDSPVAGFQAGSDDRIQSLVDRFFTNDVNPYGPVPAQDPLAKFGDAALPYIARAIEQPRADNNQARVVGALNIIRTDRSTDMLLKLYASEKDDIRQAAEYALVTQPFRKAARQAYFGMLQRQDRVDRVASACAACLEFQWTDAVPILSKLTAHPRHLRERRYTIPARRTLEGNAIPQELLDAGQTLLDVNIVERNPELQQNIEAARRLLIESEDAEAANLEAFSLAIATSKVNVDGIRELGIQILKSRPRDSTVAFLQSLAAGLPPNDRAQVEELLTMVEAKGTKANYDLATPEATSKLVELLDHDSPEVSTMAYRALLARLPRSDAGRTDPPAAGTDAKESAKQPATQSWNGKHREKMLQVASRLLASGSYGAVNIGKADAAADSCFIFGAIGSFSDYPKLKRYCSGIWDTGPEGSATAREYTRAAWSMIGEYAANAEVADLAVLVGYRTNSPDPLMIAKLLSARKDFRPTGWDYELEQLIRDMSPHVRLAATEAVPADVLSDDINDDDLLHYIKINFHDHDWSQTYRNGPKPDYFPQLQIASLELAARLQSPAFIPAIETVLAKTKNDSVRKPARKALTSCGFVPVSAAPRRREWPLLEFPVQRIESLVRLLRDSKQRVAAAGELRDLTGLDFGDVTVNESRKAVEFWWKLEQENVRDSVDESPDFLIYGTVTDIEQRPLPFVPVNIRPSKNLSKFSYEGYARHDFQTITDRNGRYLLRIGFPRTAPPEFPAFPVVPIVIRAAGQEYVVAREHAPRPRYLTQVQLENNPLFSQRTADAVFPGRPVEINLVFRRRDAIAEYSSGEGAYIDGLSGTWEATSENFDLTITFFRMDSANSYRDLALRQHFKNNNQRSGGLKAGLTLIREDNGRVRVGYESSSESMIIGYLDRNAGGAWTFTMLPSVQRIGWRFTDKPLLLNPVKAQSRVVESQP